MKLFFKILFFVLAIFQTNISEAKALVFDAVVSEITITDNEVKVKSKLTAISENDFANTCKSESDLLDYRTLVRGCEASAAKTSTQTVYRVYGDGAKALGKSWTPVNPNSVSNFRNAAGLPDVNSGRFVIEGTVNQSDIILKRNALPLNGNQGGLMEYIIDPSKVNVKRVSGVNPQF